MSRARHRLTASKQALHHARHTYQDDGGDGGGCIEVIARPTTSSGTYADVYIHSPNADGFPDTCNSPYWGQANNLYSLTVMRLGARTFNIGTTTDQIIAHRILMAFDLNSNTSGDVEIPSNAIIKSAVLHVHMLQQQGATTQGSDQVIVPHNVKIYRSKRNFSYQFVTWCSYGHELAWSSLGAGLWDNMDENDVDLNLYAESPCGFECIDYNGGDVWQTIYLQPLVQDAVSNRNGKLYTLWVRDNDLTPTYAQDLYSGGDNNRTLWTTMETPTDDKRPYLVINYCVP